MRINLYSKNCFHKVVWMQILTLKVFQTLTVRIEVVLNSRPLSPWSSDPNELDTLTPGYFLIGCNARNRSKWNTIKSFTEMATKKLPTRFWIDEKEGFASITINIQMYQRVAKYKSGRHCVISWNWWSSTNVVFGSSYGNHSRKWRMNQSR